MRLEAYGRAIERRGYESIGGGYDVTAQPGCAPFLSSVARPEGVVKTNPAETMWITTFDGKDFAFLLATKGEYETWKNKKLERILATDPLLRHGVVVESELAVRATIVDDYFKGSVDGDRIELSGPGCSLVLRRRRSE